MDLTNKVVIITGASRGLGKALAESFAARKAKLVLGARSKDQLAELAQKLGAVAVVVDVAKEDGVKNLAAKTIKQFGRIDIWINNAGVRVLRTPIEEVDVKKFHEMMEINMFGTFYGSREALKQMKKQKEGIIVNVLSTSAFEGKPNASAYGSSKMAVIGFTKYLRNEAKPAGIKVISVFPGGIKTEFHGGQIPEGYETFMPPAGLAEKIVANLEKDEPEEEQTIVKL